MLNIYKQKKSNIKENTTIKKEGVSVKNINYSPAHSREWVNSIYTFNKNTIKNLPSLDIYTSKLIKSYFNLFNSTFEKKAMLYNLNIKNRISKVNRIFVAKPEFKHTNDKVTITLYIYNLELVSYLNKMRKIKGLTFLNIFVSKITKFNMIHSTKNKMNNTTHKLHIIRTIYTKFLASISALNIKYLNKENFSIFNMEKLTSLNLIKVILSKLRMYLDIKKLIHLNKSKFNSIHILFLRNSLKKIYGKDVEFNIVSLKRYNLNSSILTQILGIKLKKRTTKFSTIMGKILSKVKIPYKTLLHIPSRKADRWNIQNLIIRNTLSNNYVKKIPMVELSNKNNIDGSKLNKVYIKRIKNDNLNDYIKYLYPQQYLINMSAKEELYLKSRNLENTVLENIKNKIVSGIRVEASGRLSRRLSGRASHDLREKGTTRNVYASYKGISSVLLRGDLNYNVDYIKTDNKGVLGSFGLKGWISSI